MNQGARRVQPMRDERMTPNWRRVIHIALVSLVAATGRPRLASAQAADAADSTARAALFGCARERALAAGFAPLPTQRAGRLTLSRANETPGPRYPLDALSFRAAADSAGRLQLEVRVTTFMMSREGISSEEVAPRASLTALADSIRARCRTTGN